MRLRDNAHESKNADERKSVPQVREAKLRLLPHCLIQQFYLGNRF